MDNRAPERMRSFTQRLHCLYFQSVTPPQIRNSCIYVFFSVWLLFSLEIRIRPKQHSPDTRQFPDSLQTISRQSPSKFRTISGQFPDSFQKISKQLPNNPRQSSNKDSPDRVDKGWKEAMVFVSLFLGSGGVFANPWM